MIIVNINQNIDNMFDNMLLKGSKLHDPTHRSINLT